MDQSIITIKNNTKFNSQFNSDKQLPTIFALETQFLLSEPAIESFEISTENSDYWFVRVGGTADGMPIWRILDGRDELIGKEVQLLGINEIGPNPQQVKVGGRLIIASQQEKDEWPFYTSTIVSLSVSRFQAAA